MEFWVNTVISTEFQMFQLIYEGDEMHLFEELYATPPLQILNNLNKLDSTIKTYQLKRPRNTKNMQKHWQIIENRFSTMQYGMHQYDLIALPKMKKIYIFIVQMFRYTISSVKTNN